MTRIGRRLRGWTNGVLDLPQDVLQELPRITLIGNKELYIENHRGVLHFSSGQLKLALVNGSLEISGEGLMIRNILGQELTVEGVIGEIRYKGSEEKT
ncbi:MULTISPECIES: sporulation protein YqfC [Paenibacillus]|uniref:Sporulation protein YqfC n=1 Tax=Paenibacillus helianthi TaxID=1349432 RepID=A0ABX3EUB2_9BACL|nr:MULTISPECIES: sporulation protein YqfC [Paenibacillus]OKP89961.1 sporulation protein YqfC [Paenibacillus sp. P32E]OKP91155.1 sporulation protein YqfC [Paenibacillus helianthi]OKP97213.1 sporulation protein YqfC [Paenibacillus sp. P46E]